MSGELIAILAVGATVAGLQWRMAGVLRTGMASLRTETRADIGNLRTEMKGDISALRNEMRENIGALKTEIREDIGALRAEMRDGFRQLDTRVRLLEERAFLGQSAGSASTEP